MFTVYEDKPLRGSPEVKGKDLERWLLAKGVDAAHAKLANTFVDIGVKYGIRGDVALIQSCLETGYFWHNTTPFDVKPEQNNFAGLGATGGGVPGDSFATPELGVEAQIQDLALRSDGKIAKEDVLSEYARKVYSTITAYHHTMWKQLAGTWAADTTYWTQIQSLMNNYNAWARVAGESGDTPAPTPEPAPVFAVTAATTKGIAILQALIDYAPMDFRINGTSPKPTPTPTPTPEPKPEPKPTPSGSLSGHSVWLDVGHGITGDQTYDSGCLGPNGEHEHVQNLAQAKAAQQYLESLGCKVTVGYYGKKGEGIDLQERAKRAKGYDCFVSVHLNAYDKKAEYSVAFVRKNPSELDNRLGNFVAGETCRVRNEQNLGAANWSDYSVLVGAASVGVPACISEACFLDSPGEVWPEDAPKFGLAIGKGIEKFLRSL